MNRFNKEKMFEGKEAENILANEVVQKAIAEMYEQLFDEEEKLLKDTDGDPRELGAKIKIIAMRRSTITDFLRQLETMVFEGRNAEFEEEQHGE